MNDLPFLPYGRQTIEDDDVAAVTDVLRSPFLTTGPVVEKFEAAFVKHVGAPFAVACSSGTAGLHMAAMALELGGQDAIVVPALTFLATANAVRYVGAEVVFADVDRETGLLGAEQLETALGEAARRGLRVRGVFPVHYAGQAVPLEPLRAALHHKGHAGAAIVEDACHAIGTRLIGQRGRLVGDCVGSDMAVFSLHPVKTIVMGEGGIVTTANPEYDRKLRRARNHGMVHNSAEFTDAERGFDPEGTPNPWYYEMPAPGYNYRASEIHCALGLSQLGKLERFVRRRRALAARYDRLIATLAPVVRPIGRRADNEPAWHLYAVRIDFEASGKSRAQVMRELSKRGIGTQVHYMPLHLQPYYRQRYGSMSLPNAEALYESLLSLPLYPAMHDDDVDRVIEAIDDVVLH